MPRSAASVVEQCAFLIVALADRQVRERTQSLSKFFKAGRFSDSGQKFLTDRPDQEGASFPDQCGKLDRPAVNDSELASKYQ